MASICVKGKTVGGGVPKVIVPVMPADERQALEAAAEAVAAGADCVELRVDFLECVHDAAAVASLCRVVAGTLTGTLLLATFRSRGQGGCLDLSQSEHAALIAELAEQGGADFVDIELELGDPLVEDLCRTVRDAGAVPVVSYHDFRETPSDRELLDLLARMERLGAGVCKFAVMANRPSDALRVMQVTDEYSRTASVPLLTMAMGACGAVTRLAGGLFGSCMTFCSLGAASAPGQVPLGEALAIMQGLHRAAS